MSLAPGTRLGVYEVTAQIGVGGMGEVYRATDSNLKRQVAIKVLPASVAGDADRLARFQREAEVLAALNHPNIAAIYGLEKTPDFTALVMELVEGEDLSEKIRSGAGNRQPFDSAQGRPGTGMPVDEVLPIAKQIAEALEAAHEQGIIHRDLKPANIKVRPDGTVKVLDFGLAKAMDPAAASSVEAMNSPTLSLHATQAGMILGTAAYMAPEQARGKTVDRRADIWAFGAVLFEMLTGTRAFEGEDIADTLGNVMKVEPNWQKLPASMPPRVVQVLRACLQKNPKQRLDSAQGVRLALEGAFETAAPPATSLGPGATAAPARTLPWAVAVASLVAAGTLLMLWAPWRSAPTVSEWRFQIPRLGVSFISPDGQRIAMTLGSGTSIAIREMNDPEPRVLPLTRPQDAFVIWSPDSRSLAYQSGFKLVKLAIDGSPPVQLADLTALGGGSWSDDGVIIVGVRKGGLQRVPASGGALTPVTTLGPGQREHALPQFIGGDRFLYVALGEKATSGIYVASLTDLNGRLVMPGEFPANRQTYTYVPPVLGAGDGYILYTTQNVLLAQAVDPSSLALKGPAVTIAQDADTLSASLNGTLVYSPASAGQGAQFGEWRWLDRTGNAIPDVSGATGGVDATISPSGRRWARSQQSDIWLHDMGDGAPSRFTFESTDDRFFTWSPDDQWIAYATGSGRAHDRILRLNTVTPSTPEPLVSGGTDLQANDWSRDGKFLLFTDAGTSSGWDMWTLDLQAKDAKPVPYLQTPAAERFGAFSPDGRWVAYQSDESGQLEVYVQSFPPGAGKFQVSAGGGISPRWRADGRELYFRSGDGLRVVRIQTSPRFEAGVPQKLFSAQVVPAGTVRTYDVTPDGSRFLVAVPPTSERDVPSVTVIVNWQAGLKSAGER